MTEPLPTPAPRASADVSGAPTSRTEPSKGWRAWPRSAIVAVLAASLLAIGGVAFGITMAAARTGASTASTSGASSASAPAAAPSASGAGAGGGTSAGKHRRSRIRGTITAISGSTWTVKAKQGTVSVTVSAATRFGAPKTPAKQSDFRVGDPVVVVSAGAAAATPQGPIKALRVLAPPSQGKASTA